jgi:eukaryotic-like serine/threonine-protein kinase
VAGTSHQARRLAIVHFSGSISRTNKESHHVSERTKKLEAIFHAVSELRTPEERESYLNEACLADADLRREVEALLKAASVGEELFGPWKKTRLDSEGVPVKPLTEQVGSMIGRYKLLEKIGEGGMGVVYMAEQEQPVRRKVALKIIKLGMDTRQVVARFEAERQALAMMDHPNIARVLDGGATDAGRPFFVMELVQGVPITEFCEMNHLPIQQRLQLFIPVCQAIQSAHQKGIIHRDIKPSNVLVTMHDAAPHPMVIDFGVAKAIDRNLTEKTLFTNFATMIGTPAYMSPEQAEMSKLDVDTRSDIYSLGVLLYELLTGTTPFPEERLRSVAYGEMQRIIAEEEPERPSTRLKKRAIAVSVSPLVTRHSLLATDLDWIVMKCLEKDRNRRYETATGLAGDIQAHLNDEPVVARPPSATYRLQKFVRRNKLEFTAATLVLIVLIVAVAVSSWQAVRAKRAEEIAREQSNKAMGAEQSAQEQAKDAEAIKDFLVRQVLAVNPYVEPEPDPGRRTMVDRVARATQTEFADRPKIEAELRFALGIAYAGLGDNREAANQFEKAYAIRRDVLGPQHSDTLWALAAIAQFYPLIGRSQEARHLMTNALGIIRRSPHPLSSGEAEVLWTYGWQVSLERPPAEALPYLREAMVVAQKTLDPKDFRLKHKMWAFAYLATRAGQWEEAETLWAEGVRQCEQDFGADHPLTAQFLKGQAHLFLRLNRVEDARLILERSIPIYHRTLGTNHNNGLDAEGLLAEAYEKLGRFEESAKLYTVLYQRWEKRLPSITARDKCEDIASFFVRHRRYDEAKAVFRGMNDSFEKNPPVNKAEFEMMVAATAAIKGWCAAGEVYQKHGDQFARDAAGWRNHCSMLLYCSDATAYHQVLTKVLASARGMTNLADQRRIAELISFGPVTFSAEQAQQCDALVESFEHALATVSTNQHLWHRAIAMIEFRRGQFPKSLAHLEIALKAQKSGQERARLLVLKAMNLHALDRPKDSRAAFDESDAIMNSRLLDDLPEREGFLNYNERTYLIFHREAQTLLGLK